MFSTANLEIIKSTEDEVIEIEKTLEEGGHDLTPGQVLVVREIVAVMKRLNNLNRVLVELEENKGA